jgi:peptide/nickel transport system substrate-binding protein
MYTYYSSQGYYHSRLNYTDKQVDAWLEEARNTTDAKKRDALYAKVGNRAFETAPFILQPAGVAFTVFNSRVKGVSKATFNPMLSFSAAGTSGTFWKDLRKE